ncbi:hypothetical protein EYF80_029468 [Liparis tanakae]|uniref:Uncharacterized protein n=1 Tax=Liparis tanakae TaxID=230148 RepID=A0A4Z2H5F1_9TELE|nr:hypothetical protein EYF80_029468 [Liparis tanakae]
MLPDEEWAMCTAPLLDTGEPVATPNPMTSRQGQLANDDSNDKEENTERQDAGAQAFVPHGRGSHGGGGRRVRRAHRGHLSLPQAVVLLRSREKSQRHLCTSICSRLHSSMIFFTSASSSEALADLGSAESSVLTEEGEEYTASPPSTVGKNIEKRDKQEEKEEMVHTGCCNAQPVNKQLLT